MRRETEHGVGSENVEEGSPEITVSMFDHSVEEHFKAVDMISNLCEDHSEFDHTQIMRLNSSVTFLREWRHFNYQPKIINFACQSESLQGKDVIGWINLPQFSAATVPKKDRHHVNTLSSEPSKDFVMHVGGHVWALDWCPRIHQNSDCHIKSEFIAVATHPPESSYHKIGAPLTGRGVIQIWSLLNVSMEEDVAQVKSKPKQKSRMREAINKSTQPLKRRGRPRKNSTVETEDNLDGNNHLVEALSVQSSNNLSKLVVPDAVSGDTLETFANKDTGISRNIETVKINPTQPKKPRGRPRKNPIVESVNLDGSNHLVQDLAVQNRSDSSTLLLHNGLSGDIQQTVAKKDSGRKRKSSSQTMSTNPKQDRGNSVQPNIKSSQPQKSRGRPRKNLTSESVEDLDINYQYVQALSVEFPEDSSELLPIGAVARRSSRKKKRVFSEEVWECSRLTTSPPRSLKDKGRGHIPSIGLPLSEQNEECSHVNPEMSSSCNLDPVWPSEKVSNNGSFETSPAKCLVPKDVVLPKAMLCLAHNGKVAWDVKWRPSNVCYTETNHRMGYLAVLLGNGALEVWEVPTPRAIKVIYSACQKEGIDPRFVKLEPVFKCSKLQCGDRLSIPLTVEWSTSSPHDLILAGCHDGVVALWKFSLNGSSKDTRPLLCFSADTVPIRALAWAPGESVIIMDALAFGLRLEINCKLSSDLESANVIVTAGHKGLKFWDLRDPFRPLWDLNPVQRVIYSLDWLQDPRCVIVSFDDGTLRILSLSKAAYDVPVTGKPYAGTQQQGLHSYYCSSFTIWSVQVSRLTGMVAYCSADGTVLRFKLTSKAVEKDPLRNRAPHFLCGSLADEESALTVITPLPDIPFPMKKSLTEWSNAPRTIRGFLSVTNQEKRAKEQMAKGQISDEQPLALLYGDDPEIEFGCDETLMAQKSKQTPKTQMNNKKKLEEANQALILRNEDPKNVERGDGEKVDTGNEIEVFPSKMVAMHRVRWNMNKGSERWLCYGGAGGIVRCQEISMSST